MSGFILFLVACLGPAALYATQPSRFLALGLIGIFAVAVILLPAERKPSLPEGSRTRKLGKER